MSTTALNLSAVISPGQLSLANLPKEPRAAGWSRLKVLACGICGTDLHLLHGMKDPRDFSISGSAKLGLLDDLIEEGKKQGRSFTPDAHPEAGSFYRSDHFTLAKRGVPAISIESGEDLVSGGRQAGHAAAEAYVRDKYHQPADEWTPAWNATGQVLDAELLFSLGERLANSREWPNWSQDSEFRAERDKTAAARR